MKSLIATQRPLVQKSLWSSFRTSLGKSNGRGGLRPRHWCPLAGFRSTNAAWFPFVIVIPWKVLLGKENTFCKAGACLDPVQSGKMKLFSRADSPQTGKEISINLGNCCSLAYGFINGVMGPGREIAFCVIAISRFVDNEPCDLPRQHGASPEGNYCPDTF